MAPHAASCDLSKTASTDGSLDQQRHHIDVCLCEEADRVELEPSEAEPLGQLVDPRHLADRGLLMGDETEVAFSGSLCRRWHKDELR
jgi:hypothetical protein